MTNDAAVGSLKAYITGEMREKRASIVERIPIPRFGGRLLLRCRTVSDRDRLRYSVAAEEASDKVEGLVQGSITLLLHACEGTETDQVGPDGKPVDLGEPLGLGLSQYLGTDAGCGQAHDDREAVVEIFGGEADIVEAAGELQSLSGATNERIAGDVAGNSGAVS